MLAKWVTVGLFLAAGLAGCVTERSSGRSGIVIAESRSYEASLYRQNCAVCHGAEAFGKTIDGQPVPGLRVGEIEKRTRAEIYQQIKHGKLPMPAFGQQLTEDEIERMVDFIIHDLQGRPRDTEGGNQQR